MSPEAPPAARPGRAQRVLQLRERRSHVLGLLTRKKREPVWIHRLLFGRDAFDHHLRAVGGERAHLDGAQHGRFSLCSVKISLTSVWTRRKVARAGHERSQLYHLRAVILAEQIPERVADLLREQSLARQRGDAEYQRAGFSRDRRRRSFNTGSVCVTGSLSSFFFRLFLRSSCPNRRAPE